MDEIFENGLNELHKKIKYIWYALFTAMLTIIVLSYILYNFQIIELTPVVDPVNADKVTLVLIVIIVLAMFFLKRSYLLASKIKQKAQKHIYNINKADFPFLALERENHALFAASLTFLNKMYTVIWFLAELVILIAFVNFILVPLINTFLIYSFVGLYSLVANYPSIKVYRKLYNYIVS
jgi:hypothetical protein